MNSIYGVHACNNELTDIIMEKLKTESLKELEKRTGLRIILFNGVDTQGNRMIILKAIRVYEDTTDFKKETERRAAELFGRPVECTFSYGEYYCTGENSNRSF